VLDFHYRKTTKESYKEFQMQILRFDDEGVKAPSRKKSSRSLLILGLVGALFGISSAFASSTININGTNTIDLAQGVVSVTGCDAKIGVQPVTFLTKDDTGTAIFRVSAVTIGYKYNNTNDGWIDTSSCSGKQMKIQFYKDIAGTPTPLTCAQLTGTTDALGTTLTSANQMTVSQTSDPTQSTSFKCQSSAIYFDVTHTQENIGFFSPKLNPDAFDYITVESTQANVSSLS
jgi:hypothetical protein